MIMRCPWDAATGLPQTALEAFARDGVLVLENFASLDACQALRQRALELVEHLAPEALANQTVFSTKNQGENHSSSQYFQDSANRMGLFFEGGAFDGAGNLAVPLAKAVNKLGHAMHDLDPVFSAFSRTPALQSVSSSLGLLDPLLVQSMYIFKQPGIGGEVNCHQDATFIYTEPVSVLGFWFAIEDAHRGNGCLGGIAGSHREASVPRGVFQRQADGVLAIQSMDINENGKARTPWDLSKVEWLEVPAGTLVVFSGLFAHVSEANRSAASRHAYTLHAVSGNAHYPETNWIVRKPGIDASFRGFDPV